MWVLGPRGAGQGPDCHMKKVGAPSPAPSLFPVCFFCSLIADDTEPTQESGWFRQSIYKYRSGENAAAYSGTGAPASVLAMSWPVTGPMLTPSIEWPVAASRLA